MGRVPVKSIDNPWCQARLKAAKFNDRFSSRAGAAEYIGMHEDAIRNTELGLEKCMPVDKAVLLADAYNAPELKNLYCREYCPIGQTLPLSDCVRNIEGIAVKLLVSLQSEKLAELKKSVLLIAADGRVTKNEVEDLQEVIAYFDDLSKTVSELKILTEKTKNEF